MAAACVFLLAIVAGITALPAPDPVLLKWDDSDAPRYSYLEDDAGKAHLVDNWLKVSDLQNLARYSPDQTNVYHLFTRDNPSVSQPMVLNNPGLVQDSNFDPNRPTVMLMHGFAGSVTSGFNTVLVPAYLSAMDCNVLVLDWSDGSMWGPRAVQAGAAGGRFINWLNALTGSRPEQFTVVGYSVGGHGAGIIARNVIGNVGYVIGCDPAERWEAAQIFRPDDGIYTEVLHTSALGEQAPMADVDFYPNGGQKNPGCLTDLCDHYRSYYFLSESLIRGGFTGMKCATQEDAHAGTCTGPETLRLGGLQAKTGSSGLYHLRTNAFQPFSQG